MRAPRRWGHVEWDNTLRLIATMSALSFLVALLGLIGELRGWWDDTGEWLMGLGTFGGVLIALIGPLYAAGRGQVRTIGHGMTHVSQQAFRIETRLAGMDTKLDALDQLEKLDTMDAKLDKLDKLDRIQFDLDRQTGILDRQVTLLTQIRDRL